MARGSFSNTSGTFNTGSFASGRLKVGLVAFNKHIATEMQSRLSQTTKNLLEGSEEQQVIWDAMLNKKQHVVVEAVAGSGKTTTLLQYCYRLGTGADVDAMTYHSLGLKTVKQNVKGGIRVDPYKVLGMLDAMNLPVPSKQEKVVKYRISSLASYAKTYGYGSDVTDVQLEKLVDRHDVDLAGFGSLIFDTVPKVLKKCCEELSTVDFDDMVWLPQQLNLTVPKYDVLCVDEYQDTGYTQQWLAVRGGVRVVAVGDPRQAIYQFRGASGDGFDKLRAQLGSENVITLPLSLTRRCPKSHVRLAQTIVPQIQALPDAPEGVVRVETNVDKAISDMKPGDLVVCRVNAPLLSTAYKLLKKNIKAVVRGRDVGQGMLKLLEAAERKMQLSAYGLPDVLREAGEITSDAVQKFLAIPQGRGEVRASNAQDRYDCLVELGQGSKTSQELKQVIERLFSDFEADGQPKHAVVLGTVHRTKGLEGNRVWVLRPDLIPHPMSKKPEDKLAELNLAYVCVTRAKFGGEAQSVEEWGKSYEGELVFVGGECSLFPIPGSEGGTDKETNWTAGYADKPLFHGADIKVGKGAVISKVREIHNVRELTEHLEAIQKEKHTNGFSIHVHDSDELPNLNMPEEVPEPEAEPDAEWTLEDEEDGGIPSHRKWGV